MTRDKKETIDGLVNRHTNEIKQLNSDYEQTIQKLNI